jgi:hypothetical protein
MIEGLPSARELIMVARAHPRREVGHSEERCRSSLGEVAAGAAAGISVSLPCAKLIN